MGKKAPNRVTENEVAYAIVQIAKTAPSSIVSFSRCKREVPNYLNLSAADKAGSLTRHNESVWEQQIRNIKSHSGSPGNYIYEGYLKHVPRVGYEATATGKARRWP